MVCILEGTKMDQILVSNRECLIWVVQKTSIDILFLKGINRECLIWVF